MKGWPRQRRAELTDTGLHTALKPTVNDIAREAGVSLATVDRVLNERPGVRAPTIEKVRAAIRKLGYVRDTAAANLARNRIYHVMFVLPDTRNEFVAALKAHVAEQAARLSHERTRLSVVPAAPFDPLDTVAILDGADPEHVDGIALFSAETPSVRDAVNRARERGIAVVALVSDLPSSARDHFVGIDNIAAGKTAARLMGRFATGPGKVLVISDSRLARDHLERRQGFDMVMAAEYPTLKVMATVEGRDDADLISRLLPEVFASHRDLRGIYASAAGNAGLMEFLADSGRCNDLVVIAHELTPAARQGLLDGRIDAVIGQDGGHLIRSSIRLLRATADNLSYIPSQERIRIDIFLKENLPAEDAVSG